MDTPGQTNFQDELVSAMAISDGAVLFIDVIVGLTVHMERMLKHALQEGLSVVLVVNAIDRLIVELKLPPTDAYHKLRHCIEEVNAELERNYEALGTPTDKRTYLSPLKGNVLFASGFF